MSAHARTLTTRGGVSFRSVALLLSVVSMAAVALWAPGHAFAARAAASVDRTMTDPRIIESSGLARSGYTSGVLWTHNDSGGGTVIYAISTSGATLAAYTVTGASAHDWEGMASARSGSTRYVYVGDIGDNGKKRATIAVHRVVEPSTLRSGSLTPTTWTFRYPDGPHNCETLLVQPGTLRIYVVTKDSAGGAVYSAPATPSTSGVNVLTKVASAPVTLSDGAFLDDGRLVLRGYERAYLYTRIGGTATTFGLPQPGESITPGFAAGTDYTGSEGKNSKIWRVTLP
ncbi:MAG: hypothetical protein ACXVXH_18175 [Nocardioidaceae bacterium]